MRFASKRAFVRQPVRRTRAAGCCKRPCPCCLGSLDFQIQRRVFTPIEAEAGKENGVPVGTSNASMDETSVCTPQTAARGLKPRKLFCICSHRLRRCAQARAYERLDYGRHLQSVAVLSCRARGQPSRPCHGHIYKDSSEIAYKEYLNSGWWKPSTPASKSSFERFSAR